MVWDVEEHEAGEDDATGQRRMMRQARPADAASGEAGPSSPRKKPRSPSPPAMTGHVCPICSKELITNNAGLNEHVDYCLSRTTIMDVAAASSDASFQLPVPTAPTSLSPSRPSTKKRKDREDDGRGRPKRKAKNVEKEFRLSQSDFGRAGFTKTR